MDIDEKEMIVRFWQKRIKRKILKVSAKEIAGHIFSLVRENWEGCNTTHLSQTHHTGFSMEKFKRLEYFDAALHFSIHTEHPIKDWKSVFCMEHEEALKQEVLKIL